MKKKIIIISAIIAFVIVSFILFASLWLERNEGSIHLTVNGQPINLNNIEITMEGEAPDYMSIINNNRFSFKGFYYWNYFSFTIPSGLLDGYRSDIKVDFETLNGNWWHHVIHTLDINIVTSGSSECTMDITYTKLLPITDRNGIRFNEKTSGSLSVTLTPENSSVSICDVME